MKQIYKLDPSKEAEDIKAIEQKIIDYSNSDNAKFREMAEWQVVIYKGYLYERTVGGEIWNVTLH